MPKEEQSNLSRSSGYTQWGDRREDAHHASRSAARQAAFIIPHLRAGMSLLDCGCGPGTITVGLAELVAPGEVVGIDLDEPMLERARVQAEKQGVSNVRFETGSVYQLPYADDSFDAIFSHAVLEHLEAPVDALREMVRVVKSGGIVGVRIPEQDGWLKAPVSDELEGLLALIESLRRSRGGDMRRGKHLRSFFNQAGLTQIQASASYDYHSTPESIQAFAALLAPDDIQPSERLLVTSGLADEQTLATLKQGVRKWANNPDAFLAWAFCEAVGWKK